MNKIVTTLGILAIFATANAFAYFDNEMNEGVNHNEGSEIYERQNYSGYNYSTQPSYVNAAPSTNYQTSAPYQNVSSQYVTPQMNNMNSYYGDSRNDNYYYPATNQNINYSNLNTVNRLSSQYYGDSYNDNYYPYSYSNNQQNINTSYNSYQPYTQMSSNSYYKNDNYYPYNYSTNQSINNNSYAPYLLPNVNTMSTANMYPQYYNDNYYRQSNLNSPINNSMQYNVASNQFNNGMVSSYCSSVANFVDCY